MASAIFSLEDTKEARAEISLLLQIEPSQLDRISHNGYLTVEFPNLLEDKALHVLSGAVANHGFQVSINHTPVKKAAVQSTTIALDSKTIARVEASGKKAQGK